MSAHVRECAPSICVYCACGRVRVRARVCACVWVGVCMCVGALRACGCVTRTLGVSAVEDEVRVEKGEALAARETQQAQQCARQIYCTTYITARAHTLTQR